MVNNESMSINAQSQCIIEESAASCAALQISYLDLTHFCLSLQNEASPHFDLVAILRMCEHLLRSINGSLIMSLMTLSRNTPAFHQGTHTIWFVLFFCGSYTYRNVLRAKGTLITVGERLSDWCWKVNLYVSGNRDKGFKCVLLSRALPVTFTGHVCLCGTDSNLHTESHTFRTATVSLFRLSSTTTIPTLIPFFFN